MNGENQNNQFNNQNNLNGINLGSTTLGGVNPTPVPNNVPNNNPNPEFMPNYNQSEVNPEPLINNAAMPNNAGPVAQPIPGTNPNQDYNNLMGSTVGTNGIPYGQPINNNNNNNFVNPNKMENIGMVPPTENSASSKKKKPMNKVLFIILILLLIGVVAYGVYYFLSISNNKVKLTVKTVNIGVGESISDKISDYVTVTKGDITTCQLNTRNINSNKIGEYKAIITCGEETYESKVVVSDKTAPTVELTPVFKTINETVKVEDFVKSCTDPSNCTTSFTNETAVNDYMKTAGGPYKVEIEAKDSAGNSATYTAELYVTNYSIVVYTNCTSESTQLNNYQASKIITDVLPIGRNDEGTFIYLGVSRRVVEYTFTNETEYAEVTKDKPSTITFDGVTGTAKYDDANKTLTISSDLPLATLNSENNGEFPVNFSDFRNLYTNKGYQCSNLSIESTKK